MSAMDMPPKQLNVAAYPCTGQCMAQGRQGSQIIRRATQPQGANKKNEQDCSLSSLPASGGLQLMERRLPSHPALRPPKPPNQLSLAPGYAGCYVLKTHTAPTQGLYRLKILKISHHFLTVEEVQ